MCGPEEDESPRYHVLVFVRTSRECCVLPSSHVPHSNFPIAASTDQNIIPWDHCPYSHHMALKGLLVVTVGIIDVDLRIIQRNDNILRSEVKTCHHTLVRSDMALGASTAFVPRGLNHVFLFEL